MAHCQSLNYKVKDGEDDKIDVCKALESTPNQTSKSSLSDLFLASSNETIVPQMKFNRNDPFRKEVPFNRRRQNFRVIPARPSTPQSQCGDYFICENRGKNLLGTASTASTSTIAESISFFKIISSYFEKLSTDIELEFPDILLDNVVSIEKQPKLFMQNFEKLEILMEKLSGILHLLVVHQKFLFKKRKTVETGLKELKQMKNCTDTENNADLSNDLADVTAQLETKKENLYNEWIKSIHLFNICDEMIHRVQDKIITRFNLVLDCLTV